MDNNKKKNEFSHDAKSKGTRNMITPLGFVKRCQIALLKSVKKTNIFLTLSPFFSKT